MADKVLITGANRGIGLELARQYASAGWRVHACCRQPERAVELNRVAAASAGRLSVHPLDVTSPAQIAALPTALGDEPLDLLINNAGIYGQDDASFGNTDVRAWLQAFHVNAIAPLKVMEALVEPVARSGRRVMACVSSKMGSMADNRSGGSYVYRSSKAALNAVVMSAAVDLRHRGVTVVALNPGWVKTDMGGPTPRSRSPRASPRCAPSSIGWGRRTVAASSTSTASRFPGEHAGAGLPGRTRILSP